MLEAKRECHVCQEKFIFRTPFRYKSVPYYFLWKQDYYSHVRLCIMTVRVLGGYYHVKKD